MAQLATVYGIFHLCNGSHVTINSHIKCSNAVSSVADHVGRRLLRRITWYQLTNQLCALTSPQCHCKSIFTVPTLSSLVAPEVVITNSGAASDDQVGIMATFVNCPCPLIDNDTRISCFLTNVPYHTRVFYCRSKLLGGNSPYTILL